jgi:dihydroflavonol-4-reductase
MPTRTLHRLPVELPLTLVTGATGFLGSHVVRALLDRGEDVRVTIRSSSNLEALRDLECDRVLADITDPRGTARAMQGVSRLYHLAGSTHIREDEQALTRANVDGTRIVMEAALEAGVERVVHTSSITAIGPAPRGSTADETQMPKARDLGHLPEAAAKLAAEHEVLRAAARGLNVTIVNPAFVFGPGDHLRSSTDIVRRFLLKRIPAYVDGGVSIVDVRDVAQGMLLAAEHGRQAERYILGDRNYTWERLFAEIGRCSGIEPPAVKLPAEVALAIAGTPLVGDLHPHEVRAAAHYWTYRSTKARTELGWTTRPHEETVEATVAWWRARLGDRLKGSGRQPLVLRLTGAYFRTLSDIARTIAD